MFIMWFSGKLKLQVWRTGKSLYPFHCLRCCGKNLVSICWAKLSWRFAPSSNPSAVDLFSFPFGLEGLHSGDAYWSFSAESAFLSRSNRLQLQQQYLKSSDAFKIKEIVQDCKKLSECWGPWQLLSQSLVYCSWQGLRGAIPYALSLHLGLEPIEKRQLIGTTTIIIVLFTILLLGGGTMPLIRLIDIEDSKARKRNKKDINLSKTEKMVGLGFFFRGSVFGLGFF